mmetsp:Transcript_25410/g.74817  ORF Transcript_25410/g.74817 Transcript_25410/m.74817 type:complete len:100 (+) Transcript_25410:674-973(+)
MNGTWKDGRKLLKDQVLQASGKERSKSFKKTNGGTCACINTFKSSTFVAQNAAEKNLVCPEIATMTGRNQWVAAAFLCSHFRALLLQFFSQGQKLTGYC